MKTFSTIIMVFIFFISLSLPLLGQVFGLDSPTFASLQTMQPPEIVKEDQINWSFPDQFNDYWGKNFPFQSWMVSRFNHLMAETTRSSVNDKVIVGRSGYLYFAETMDDILKVPRLSDHQLLRLTRVVQLQKDFVERHGGTFHFIVTPNKATIYPEYLPNHLKAIGSASNIEQLSILSPDLQALDVTKILMNLKTNQRGPIYHQLDSHWNGVGATHVANLLLQRFGVNDLIPEDFQAEKNWQGDLSTMFYPDRQTPDWQYTPQDFEPRYTELRPMRTFEDIRIETRSQGVPINLLMYRDSFSNALIPIFSSRIQAATYLRSSKNDLRVIESIEPDQVVYQIVERNLDWILKETPIMPAPVVSVSLQAIPKKLPIEVTAQSQYGMYFINGQWTRDGETIERVLIESKGQVWEAFPIHQTHVDQADVTDGFSLYLPEPTEDFEIYYFQQGEWYQQSSKIQPTDSN